MDGAPLEHRPLAAGVRADRRDPESCADHRPRRARPRGLRSPAHAANQDGRDDPRQQCARHHQPGRRAGGEGEGGRGDGAGGRRAGSAAHARRRAARLAATSTRSPDTRSTGRRAPASSTGRAAMPRRDAAVPGRRRHDLVGHLREDPLQRAAVQVRGRDAEHRGRRRSRRRRSSMWRGSIARPAPRTRTRCSLTRPSGWREVAGYAAAR